MSVCMRVHVCAHAYMCMFMLAQVHYSIYTGVTRFVMRKCVKYTLKLHNQNPNHYRPYTAINIGQLNSLQTLS